MRRAWVVFGGFEWVRPCYILKYLKYLPNGSCIPKWGFERWLYYGSTVSVSGFLHRRIPSCGCCYEYSTVRRGGSLGLWPGRVCFCPQCLFSAVSVSWVSWDEQFSSILLPWWVCLTASLPWMKHSEAISKIYFFKCKCQAFCPSESKVINTGRVNFWDRNQMTETWCRRKYYGRKYKWKTRLMAY